MHKKMNTSNFDKILVVDDTTANLQLLTNLLTEHGYTVYPASAGELALEFIQSTLPDLILLDIRMPGLDGFEVCRRLKADERTHSIPIIFISILEDKHDKVKGFQAGAVDYITKPFQPEEVLARVRIHLRLRELTEQLEHKVAERTKELHAANARLQRELAERIKAEAALRQSEILLNATQRLAKIGGWDWDIKQQTSFWTEETYRIHGIEPEASGPGSTELIDRSLACYDPDDRAVIFAAFERCAQQGDGYDLEFPFTSTDGCRKWIRTTATAVREEGRIVKVVGNIMDITKQKQAEEKLRRSENYKAIQNKIANIFLTIPDEEMYGEVLAVVLQAMISKFGLFGFIETNGDLVIPSMTREILNECKIPDKSIIFPPATWGNSLWGKAIREKRSYLSDGPFHAPEGHVRIDHFLTAPIVLGIETIGLLSVANKEKGYTEEDQKLLESVAGFISPILNARLQRDRKEQERKRTEQALRLEEKKYRTLVENTPDLIVRYNTDLRRIFVNPAWEKASSLVAADVVDVPQADIPNVSQPVVYDYYAKLRSVLETETSQVSEFSWVNAGGEKLILDYMMVPEYDHNGKIIGVLAVGHDITARKRMEEKVYILNQELEQRVKQRTSQLEAANQELGAFAYSVSHDLRAPLRHIDGFLELLQKKAGTALDEQGRHYMDIISDSVQKMGALIDDLLSFSQMGRKEMLLKPVDIGTMVRAIIREFEPDTAGRNIVWRIGDLPAVRGDASMLRIVLGNLISNALKFTRPRRQAQIEIGSLPDRTSETVIFIRDNGIGFDVTYADKLFGVFQRLHRADEFEGTGIGLANVHRIITRHGGRTWAESEPDRGATFFFALPLT